MSESRLVIVPDVLLKHSGARTNVYLALAQHCDAAGTCWPSLRRLSEATGLARSTVVTALAWLVEAGMITRTARHDERGKTSNLYVLHHQRRSPDGPYVPPTTMTDQVGLPGPESRTTMTGPPAHPGPADEPTLDRPTGHEHRSENTGQGTPTPPTPAAPGRKRDLDHDEAIAILEAAFPGDPKLHPWATELLKVHRRGPTIPVARLARLSCAVLRLADAAPATLPAPDRSALMARLDALSYLAATPAGLRQRWDAMMRDRPPATFPGRIARLVTDWAKLEHGPAPTTGGIRGRNQAAVAAATAAITGDPSIRPSYAQIAEAT